MRRAHLMQRNHGNEQPQAAIWFDTETWQEQVDPVTKVHHLTFGWAAYRRRRAGGLWTKPEWIRFTGAGEFWSWVADHQRDKTRLYAFCHNTSFDLPVLDCFTQLPALGYVLHRAVIDAPPTILKWRYHRSTLTIMDTLNIWRMPLATLGDSIGLAKMEMPRMGDSTEAWDAYAMRDVEVIMKACLAWWDFLQANDLGGFAPTLAGQAMRTFRHRFMNHKILLDDSPRALDISRAAYLGGRCECWRLGDITGPLHLLDVNSLYPSVMADNLFPAVLRTSTTRATVRDLEKWLGEGTLTARVMVSTAEPVYAVRRADRLVFPVGEFEAALSSPELAYAMENGHLTRILAVALYDAQPLFRDYVMTLYKLRLAAVARGDTVEAMIFKLLLNSLYGKMGQRGLVYVEEGRTVDLSALKWDEVDAETGQIIRWRQLAGLVQRQENEAESRESHPAIAAHVCAYGRMTLWKLIQAAGVDNVFYMDTDSLLVNDAGLDRLGAFIDPSRLGALKRVDTYTDATLRGPKDYRLGTVSKTKGVRGKAVWLSPSRVQQEKWDSLRGLLAQGHLDKPSTRLVEKNLKRQYSKGIVNPDGRVRPLQLTTAGDPI